HISLSQLSSFPFLAREKGSAGRSLIDSAFELHGLSIKPSWESTSTQAIIKAVKEGLGVAILPEQLIASEIKSGRLLTKEFEDESFQRKNYIITHKQKLLTPMEEEFIRTAIFYSKAANEMN
ncbi:MAG: LysR substrate-binding domain-containing protein, partial [Sphaerochaetaceae bacterium]|nr:LysR substrate-binding domain-containing protein [Sphaerochaetaceae bacterium]